MDAAAIAAFLQNDFGALGGDFRIERVDDSGITLRLKISGKYLRTGNTVSGPAVFALADVAVYLAILSRLGMGAAMTVTSNCSIDFMRKPAAGLDLLATARVLKLGRTLAVGDALMYSDGQAEPVARASLTYAVARA